MKLFSFVACLAVLAAVPLTAEAGRRHHGGGCCCGGGYAYAAPAAASPAADVQGAAAQAAPAVIAQNQGQGYRSFSYQPGASAPAPVMNYNGGNGGYGGYRANNYQPVWMNGANKSLGRVN